MPSVSSFFLVVSLVLAVTVGPQTRSWSWGPSLLALCIAVLASLPVYFRARKPRGEFLLLAIGTIAAGWFAWRAFVSPVIELAQADLILLGAAAATLVCIRAIAGHGGAERILIWGIAILLLANLVVIGIQIVDPTFSPIFRSRAAGKMVSGFFAHYNETANYLIASSMLVGAAALVGRHATATRILWLLIAVAGLAGVWFTRSRGGILGAAVACAVFAAILLAIGKNRGRKWFGPALVALPVVGVAVGAFLYLGWHQAQELRSAGSGISGLLDNDIRLYLLGIAASCVKLHPLLGGGSRSFSWESFQFFEPSIQRHPGNRPELIHNELLQAAADYGLIGATLLLFLLGMLAVVVVVRILMDRSKIEPNTGDAWRLGALSALVGMLVQSSFSFVFHLMPGVLLLGICLGKLSGSTRMPTPRIALCSRALLVLAGTACIVLLAPAGWSGTKVTRILWPTHFSKNGDPSIEARIDALMDALAIHPLSSLYQERATLLQTMADSEGGLAFQEYAERAIADYGAAAELHPYEPAFAINRANLLSRLDRNKEAEHFFDEAIRLQGGMESGFRSHFSAALHYFNKGLRLAKMGKSAESLAAHEASAEQMELAVKGMHWITSEMHGPRLDIHETLGAARETSGDPAGAIAAYDFAANLREGRRVHYRAAVLIGKLAVDAWSRREPEEALAKFIAARQRVAQTQGRLPAGVSTSERDAYVAYLDRTIQFLKGAKVVPAGS